MPDSRLFRANAAVGEAELNRLQQILNDDETIRLVIIDLNITLESAIGAAVVAHNAHKFVIVRPTAVKGPDDFPPKLWDHTHIVIANDYEAPQLLAIPWNQHHNGVHHPLRSLQEGSVAAKMLFEKHPHLVAVIITTSFGNVCRVRVRGELCGELELHIPGATPPPRETLIQESEACDYATLVVPHFDTKVVDAIGAADAYLGAVVAGVAHGVPLSHALVWGAAGCAIAVMVRQHALLLLLLLSALRHATPRHARRMTCATYTTRAYRMLIWHPGLIYLIGGPQRGELNLYFFWVPIRACLQAPGAQAAMPTLDRLQEFCQRRDVGVHPALMGHPLELIEPTDPLPACERWPSGRPAASDAVRTLERMLHESDSVGFAAGLAETHATDPGSLNQPVDFQGQTLLHLAVVYGDMPALCLLLQCDADFYIKDRCNDFDIALGHFARRFQPHASPTRAVGCALGVHAHWMLMGACNPTLWPCCDCAVTVL